MAYKKTGLFGGTFDPIHNGHIKLALAAFKKFDLDKILFMPADDPYYKQDKGISSFSDRLEMVNLAIKDYPAFIASSFEKDNDTDGFTINTLKKYRLQFPDEDIYFIIGGDTLFSIEKWKDIEQIFSIAKFLVSKRKDEIKGASGSLGASFSPEIDSEGFDDLDNEVDIQIKYLEEKYGAKIYNIYAPVCDISSSDIRRNIRENKPVDGFLPDAVLKYIKNNNLYGEI